VSSDYSEGSEKEEILTSYPESNETKRPNRIVGNGLRSFLDHLHTSKRAFTQPNQLHKPTELYLS